MPIKSINTTPAPGHLVQVCAVCGAEHKISFDRGAQKTKTGPFALKVGDALELRIDGGRPVLVRLNAGDFPDFGAVTAAQLAAKLELPGARAIDDHGGVLIESRSTGPKSSVVVTGGTARVAIGFPSDDRAEPDGGRPVLGVSGGSFSEALRDKNALALRRCADCGSTECLVRSFDAIPPELNGSFFAKHREAVNALAEHFKGEGWSHPDVAAAHSAEESGAMEIDLRSLKVSGPESTRGDERDGR